MSDINLDFTVSNNSIDFTVQPNDITITPEEIQLTINSSYSPGAGGNITELQYNNGSLLAGIPTATYNGSNLSLGNVANLKITGGTNGFVLQTDGTGNLDWTAQTGGGGNGSPGGSNTQIQYNDNGLFGGNAGFTFNEVTGNVAMPGNLSVIGNIAVGLVSAGNVNATSNVLAQNINSNANIIGVNFTANGNASITGNISANNATFSNITLNSNVVHLGNNAGSNAGPFSVAIGAGAGDNNQGFGAIAIGVGAGVAGNGQYSIAIGADAGLGVQGNSAIAIGTSAGLIGQSDYVIAIGASAGQDGPFNQQANNTIVLNATGANLVGNSFANAFYVKPVRNANTANIVFYNPTSGELSYDAFIVNTANYANYAGEAFYVTGSNVNGTVANANFSTFSGTSTVANTANIANSVALANVVGIGNIANINRNGNANTFLNGNGVFTVPVFTNANFANFAGTVVNSNQPNITTTGTLANLLTSGLYMAPASNGVTTLGLTGQRWSNAFINNLTITNGATMSYLSTNFSSGNGNAIIAGTMSANAVNFVSNISSNITPSTATSTTPTHKIPIVLNGVTYYICLTNTI
jgi:hypothetical protein